MLVPCRYAPPLSPYGGGRLSSPYGFREGRTTGERTFHAGADFAAERGTPVHACAPGVIETIARDDGSTRGFNGYGNAVVIRHEDEAFDGHKPLWTFYAHLDEAAMHAEGQKVMAGQPIGRVGNTSNGKFAGMGVHLHLELRHAQKDGSSPFPGPYRWNNLDPLEWLAAHGITFEPEPVIDFAKACPQPRLLAALESVLMPWRGARR